MKIIMVGKTKESFWKEAEGEYLKRLKAFVRMDIVVLESSRVDFAEKAIFDEGEEILSRVKADDLLIALDRGGKQIDSEGLAKRINKWQVSGKNIVFVIGGTYGLSQIVIDRADFVWSFGELTYTHEMARVVLLEQIYRAFMIKSGRSYHY